MTNKLKLFIPQKDTMGVCLGKIQSSSSSDICLLEDKDKNISPGGNAHYRLTSPIVEGKIWRCENEKYAIKIIRDCDKLDLGQVLKKEYPTLRYKHLLQYEYCEQIGNTLYCVMEYINSCNLSDYLRENKLSIIDYRICRQMLEAIKFCHERNLVHGDISLKNFMIVYYRGFPHIILIDFDYLRYLDQAPYVNPRGTLLYLAPEIIKKPCRYDYRVDIWALGVCFYYISTRQYPFKGSTQNDILHSILHSTPDYSGLMGEIKQDIQDLLNKDPEQRCTLSGLCRSIWLQCN